jgi:hypothetical protein
MLAAELHHCTVALTMERNNRLKKGAFNQVPDIGPAEPVLPGKSSINVQGLKAVT